MPTGLGLRPGRESAGQATDPYRLRASPRLYQLWGACERSTASDETAHGVQAPAGDVLAKRPDWQA